MKSRLNSIFAALLGIAATATATPSAATTPGKTMDDGTKFVSFATGGRVLFTTPHDAPGPSSLRQLTKYCGDLTFAGRTDWHVPSAAETFALSLNSTEIGNFAKPGKFPKGYYHSSTTFGNPQTDGRALATSPESGDQVRYKRSANFYMLGRCVRTESISSANVLTVR